MELYLLMLANSSDVSQILIINGHQLYLSGPFDIENEDSIPPYACVSYVWGSNRLENPLFHPRLMSDQTLPALETVIRAVSPAISAFWIDAFCIPYHYPARHSTLESMGYIYSAADCVVAALDPECHEGLLEMNKQGWLAEDTLTLLEHNPWIASVWTYQEIVNSRKHLITSMIPESPVIEDETFFSQIGHSLDKYKRRKNCSSTEMRRLWPHLDGFEDLEADCMLNAPFQRPVLNVMAMLDLRVAHKERNKCYAMIGTLTPKTTREMNTSGGDLAKLRQKVMNICIEKHDWSFIYSSTMRDETEPWMPSSRFELKSILPYPIHGSGQSGRQDKSGKLLLENVLVIRNVLKMEHEVDIAALRYMISILPLHIETHEEVSEQDLRQQIRSILSSIGFTGHGEEIISTYGIFYPQIPILGNITAADIVICTELRWMFGRPGMLIARRENGTTCIPGVLVQTTILSSVENVEDYMLGGQG